MAWDDTKETCANPPCSEAAKKITAAEWNAMVTDQKARLSNSLFDAYSILYADVDDTPAALTVAASRLVGRKSTGGIAALTAAEAKTLLAIDHGADLVGLTDDDHTQYLLAAGSRALSADWDAGSHKITAEQLESDIAIGTAPLIITSTTVVTNLNADRVDGKHLADLLEVADGDFNAFGEKASPVNADIVLIEDSAASYAKKKVQLVNLPGGGASTWLGLTDTPAAFTDQAGKYPKVNVGETALEFGVPAGGGDFMASGIVPMTGDLKTTNILRTVDNANLGLWGGTAASHPATLDLYGDSCVVFPGQAIFKVPNAAKTARIIAGYFEGVTDTPHLVLEHGLDVDLIEEKIEDAGVIIDSCQIKDGKAADTLKVVGKSWDTPAEGDDDEIVFYDHPNSKFSTKEDNATIQVVFDGGESAIAVGTQLWVEVPFSCAIQQETLLADVSGSIKIDIWKDTYANYPPTDADTITGANEPEIVADIKDQDSTLTDWIKTIVAGDILVFNVDSCTTITKCTVSLKVKKTT